jgi:hypothetical protein
VADPVNIPNLPARFIRIVEVCRKHAAEGGPLPVSTEQLVEAVIQLANAAATCERVTTGETEAVIPQPDTLVSMEVNAGAGGIEHG